MPPALCLFHADCVLFGHFLKPDVCFTLCPLCRSVRSPWMWAASGAGTPMQCTPVDVEQLEQEAKQAADTVEPTDDEPTPLGQAPPPPRNPVEKPTQASQPTLFTPSEASPGGKEPEPDSEEEGSDDDGQPASIRITSKETVQQYITNPKVEIDIRDLVWDKELKHGQPRALKTALVAKYVQGLMVGGPPRQLHRVTVKLLPGTLFF